MKHFFIRVVVGKLIDEFNSRLRYRTMAVYASFSNDFSSMSLAFLRKRNVTTYLKLLKSEEKAFFMALP